MVHCKQKKKQKEGRITASSCVQREKIWEHYGQKLVWDIRTKVYEARRKGTLKRKGGWIGTRGELVNEIKHDSDRPSAGFLISPHHKKIRAWIQTGHESLTRSTLDNS